MNRQVQKEYDEIYEQYADAGFEFTYGNRHISKSRFINREAMMDIPRGKGNGDKMFVICRDCGVYMDFGVGNDILDGWWVCPECGTRMRERTAYSQLDRENEEFLEELDLEEDWDDFED